MNMTKTEYARLGAQALMRRAVTKRRKIDAILYDRDIEPALTHEARDGLVAISCYWQGIESEADRFLAAHVKPDFPKGDMSKSGIAT